MEAPAADPAPARAPYIECDGCHGKGFTMARREHNACNGAGILILRIPRNGAEPYYGAPKLR